MKNNLYVIYDNVGLRYGQVYAFPTDGYALLELRPVILGRNNDKTALERYEVCHIGEIDIETGKIDPAAPKRIPWSSTPYLETKAEEEPATLPLKNS